MGRLKRIVSGVERIVERTAPAPLGIEPEHLVIERTVLSAGHVHLQQGEAHVSTAGLVPVNEVFVDLAFSEGPRVVYIHAGVVFSQSPQSHAFTIRGLLHQGGQGLGMLLVKVHHVLKRAQ